MRLHMHPNNTWSFRSGHDILERKRLLKELSAIAEAYDTHGGGNQNLSGRQEVLAPLDWQQEASVKYEAETADGPISRRADFDAYKHSVAVEHERGEQMRANWHLMKIEAAYVTPAASRATVGLAGKLADRDALALDRDVDLTLRLG